MSFSVDGSSRCLLIFSFISPVLDMAIQDILRINPRTYNGFVAEVNGETKNFPTQAAAIAAGAANIKPNFEGGLTGTTKVTDQQNNEIPKGEAMPAMEWLPVQNPIDATQNLGPEAQGQVATPDSIEDIEKWLAVKTAGTQPVPVDQQKTVGIVKPEDPAAYKPADYIQQQIAEVQKQQWLATPSNTRTWTTATTLPREVGGGATARTMKDSSTAVQGAASNTNQMNQNIKG